MNDHNLVTTTEEGVAINGDVPITNNLGTGNTILDGDLTLERIEASLKDVNGNNGTCIKLSKKTKRYYKKQTAVIAYVRDFESSSSDLTELNGDVTDEAVNRWMCRCHPSPQTVAQITFAINFCLFCAKTLAAVLSGSLSVISSVLDSAVDLVSGILLWISSRAIKKTDIKVYPRGRGRLEPVSITVLAVIMSLASCQVIFSSVQTIITYANYDIHCNLSEEFLNGNASLCGAFETLTSMFRHCMDGANGPLMELPTILICSFTIAIKFVMFVVCRRMSNATIRALAQDHRNDVISNFVALSFGFMGYKLFKYIDPIGAILISFYVIITWSMTAMEQIKVITGYTADSTTLNALTWFILRHHPDIKYLDDIRAFHQSAEGYVVEADIILPPTMGLQESHDIGENLKKRLERLPEVERAFVHVDYVCNKYGNKTSDCRSPMTSYL